MRRSKWSRSDQAGFGRKQATDRVNSCGLEALLETHRRQDAGDTLRQHRLSRPRRSDHQHVVAAGHCDFNGAFRMVLAANIAEIFGAWLSIRGRLLTFDAKRINRARTVDEINDLGECS